MSNPNYYEVEEFTRRRRDPSPGHFSGGGGGPPGNAPYNAPYERPNSGPPINGPPFNGPPPPPPPPPGAPPYVSTPRVNDAYPPRPPSPRETMTLEPPAANIRPRSVPPPNTSMIRRTRSRSSSTSSSDSDRRRSRGSRSRSHRGKDRERSPSPISRARNAVEDNFSNSATGIGAGLLGAVVGGLVAREANDAANRKKHKSKGYREADGEDRTRMVSTILGAVAGGLASNAIANRVEDSRDRDRARQYEWERRYGREEDRHRYDAMRIESGPRDSRRDRALPPPDDDYDDLVYDDPQYDDRRLARRRSEESYRFRS
ncbi:hypothetical protein AK830_g12017 [Neonectria ditissima]|uniref:Glycine zipper 2TM domain-containing protein n=1 Tax=Neonectria ditissima TaxID=78410 RepID=A0A0P7ABK1_9HYPO|nr:hypothetical protein AK830_g12017 [Neonectria ditissima]